MMYDELVKALREHSKRDNCNCDTCFAYDAEMRGYTTCSEELTEKAADAIEELSRRLDESVPKGDAEIIISEVAKPRWIPVPEHGDLIDRNKLEKDIERYVGGEESRSRFHHWVQVQRSVILKSEEEQT